MSGWYLNVNLAAIRPYRKNRRQKVNTGRMAHKTGVYCEIRYWEAWFDPPTGAALASVRVDPLDTLIRTAPACPVSGLEPLSQERVSNGFTKERKSCAHQSKHYSHV